MNLFLNMEKMYTILPVQIKMKYDRMSVVDAEGRLHGIQNLRVVDASIMPEIITGNLNACTIMMAEKIADTIRGLPPLPPIPVDYFIADKFNDKQ